MLLRYWSIAIFLDDSKTFKVFVRIIQAQLNLCNVFLLPSEWSPLTIDQRLSIRCSVRSFCAPGHLEISRDFPALLVDETWPSRVLRVIHPPRSCGKPPWKHEMFSKIIWVSPAPCGFHPLEMFRYIWKPQWFYASFMKCSAKSSHWEFQDPNCISLLSLVGTSNQSVPFQWPLIYIPISLEELPYVWVNLTRRSPEPWHHVFTLEESSPSMAELFRWVNSDDLPGCHLSSLLITTG